MKFFMSDIIGVILCGGISSRMGMNKSLLKIENKTLIEIIYERIKKVFDKIIISTNEPDDYSFLPIEKIKDIYPNLGPLSGIHSSLSYVNEDKIFIISCNTPFITTSLIKHLLTIQTDEPIIIPKAKDKVQYLIGIYSKEILPIAQEVLDANTIAKRIYEEKKLFTFSIENFIERVGAEIVNVENEIFYFSDLFFNMNTPEDYEYVKEKLF